MFDPKDFPFNADKMAEFFKNNDFASSLSQTLPGAADDIIASQKKNMEALVAANKAAAVSYQDLFAKQLHVFEKTMDEAKAAFADANSDTKGKAAKSAFESAFKNMNEMATGAQKANAEAMEIIGQRVQASLKEMQELAEKSKK